MPSHKTNHQLSLGPVEVRRSDNASDAVRNSDSVEQAGGNADKTANSAAILDEAFKSAGLDSKEIAHLCGVSVSLVDKWRSTTEDRAPSFAQMLLLPPSFHIALHRVMNRRYGFGRAALARLLDAAGDLAVVGLD